MTTNPTKSNQKQPEVSTFCNLTEQWKKGELEIDQYYYVKYADGSVEIQLYVGGFVMRTDNQVVKVLAPVPSYEEHQQLIKFLEEFNALDVAKENQQLKGLLKRVRGLWKGTVCMPDSQEQVRDILAEIDNAIGEKK